MDERSDSKKTTNVGKALTQHPLIIKMEKQTQGGVRMS